MELTLSQKRLHNKILRLEEQSVLLTMERESLRKKCKHEVFTKTPGCNTGGYDGVDHYWNDYKCGICGHWWRGDEHTSNIWGR